MLLVLATRRRLFICLAALDHATPLYTALGDTVKVVKFVAESITFVKSCEKHLNSVKATDIRTHATDVETRKNIIQ